MKCVNYAVVLGMLLEGMAMGADAVDIEKAPDDLTSVTVSVSSTRLNDFIEIKVEFTNNTKENIQIMPRFWSGIKVYRLDEKNVKTLVYPVLRPSSSTADTIRRDMANGHEYVWLVPGKSFVQKIKVPANVTQNARDRFVVSIIQTTVRGNADRQEVFSAPFAVP